MNGTRRPVVRINRPVAERAAPVRAPRLRIGLLGGSFNPAHAGHRAISLEALRRLAAPLQDSFERHAPEYGGEGSAGR